MQGKWVHFDIPTFFYPFLLFLWTSISTHNTSTTFLALLYFMFYYQSPSCFSINIIVFSLSLSRSLRHTHSYTLTDTQVYQDGGRSSDVQSVPSTSNIQIYTYILVTTGAERPSALNPSKIARLAASPPQPYRHSEERRWEKLSRSQSRNPIQSHTKTSKQQERSRQASQLVMTFEEK